jgi:mannose-6-phosphate isomerase class I
VIGHNARDKAELQRMIEDKKWQQLIRVRPVKKGDFFQIEPGTVHAIKAGTLLLETQQSSDITYRLYDYDRLDNGKPRTLNIKQSIDVIRCPHRDAVTGGSILKTAEYDREEMICCAYYTVNKVSLHGEQDFVQEFSFLNISVIDGSGEIDGRPLKKGDHFILPYGYGTYHLKGCMELIESHV